MRFREIQLTNFRSHRDTTLELDRITVIRGPNSAGKSSIEQALEIALGRRAEGTTADGKGSFGLIRLGENKAKIRLVVEREGDPRVIECALKGTERHLIVTKPGDPTWDGGTRFETWLHVNRQLLSCLINNRYFVEADEDTQKSILSAIILPKEYVWPAWVIPTANSLGLKIDWKMAPADVIATGYELAFKERTGINRDLKNFRMPQGDTTAAEGVNLEEMETKLSDRKAELEAAIREHAAANAAGAQNEQARAQIQKRKDEAQARVTREEQHVTTLDGMLLSAAKLKEARKTAASADKVKQADDELATIKAELNLVRERNAQIQALVNTPRCPTCATEITEELLSTLAVENNAKLDVLLDREEAAIAARKKLSDPETAQRAIAQHEQAEKDMTAAKARIKDDQAIIRETQGKLDALPSAATPAAEPAGITDLRERVAKGEAAVRAARAAADLQKRIEAATKERATLQQKSQDVEKLVKYFGEEVQAELLAASIAEFTDLVNRVLSQSGYSAQISIDPYVFAVTYHNDEGHTLPVPLKHLSKSLRYRFAVAFQVALAIVSGFRFVVVDEADIFDSVGRNVLFRTLEKLTIDGELEQAIVLSTDERDSAPMAEGRVFYRFDNVAEAGSVPTTAAGRL